MRKSPDGSGFPSQAIHHMMFCQLAQWAELDAHEDTFSFVGRLYATQELS